MNLQTFYDHFEYLADAPNGVAKLREMILQLAVQGKLVPQDPNDEPAFVLLKKIKAEKEKLIKQGKIKNPKPLPPVTPEEVPYELPEGWEWVRLGEVLFRISNGFSGKQNKNGEGYPLSRIETISKAEVDMTKVGYCPDIPKDKLDYYKLEAGDILLSHINSDLHLGKTAIVPENIEIYHGVNLILIRLFPLISSKYVNLSLSNLRFSGYFSSIAQHAIGQSSINQGKIVQTVLSLPPQKEQHRIASKVDQLMDLCDQLETRQQKKETARARLNQSITTNLLTAPTPKAFTTGWQGLCHNFDLLYDTPETIPTLRQTILQLAVQGKLVPQDPNDEPASVLLEKIKAEKEKLIKQGRIKKSKPLPPVTPEEVPYELPEGWEWVRLVEICSYIQRGKGPKYIEKSNIPVISQKCIQWNGFQIDKARFIDPASLKNYGEERFLQDGDLLWNSTGTGTIGRVNVYRYNKRNYDKVVADSHVTVVRPLLLNSNYLYIFLASPTVQDDFEDRASGTTNQIELNTSTVKNQTIPLPPLAEQHRIAAKVDQLMSMCDQLEEKLTQSTANNQRLTEAVIHYLTAA